MKISDTTPFLKQPLLFYQPFHFYGKKNLIPSPILFFFLNFETQPQYVPQPPSFFKLRE